MENLAKVNTRPPRTSVNAMNHRRTNENADIAAEKEMAQYNDWDEIMNKWVIIGAIGNIALVVLNAINLWRHW